MKTERLENAGFKRNGIDLGWHRLNIDVHVTTDVKGS